MKGVADANKPFSRPIEHDQVLYSHKTMKDLFWSSKMSLNQTYLPLFLVSKLWETFPKMKYHEHLLCFEAFHPLLVNLWPFFVICFPLKKQTTKQIPAKQTNQTYQPQTEKLFHQRSEPPQLNAAKNAEGL